MDFTNQEEEEDPEVQDEVSIIQEEG